jgi:hypothetical protein
MKAYKNEQGVHWVITFFVTKKLSNKISALDTSRLYWHNLHMETKPHWVLIRPARVKDANGTSLVIYSEEGAPPNLFSSENPWSTDHTFHEHDKGCFPCSKWKPWAGPGCIRVPGGPCPGTADGIVWDVTRGDRYAKEENPGGSTTGARISMEWGKEGSQSARDGGIMPGGADTFRWHEGGNK